MSSSEKGIHRPAFGRQLQYNMSPESGHMGCDRKALLDFCLLGDFKRVIHLDTEVSNRAFQLEMAQQELNGS